MKRLILLILLFSTHSFAEGHSERHFFNALWRVHLQGQCRVKIQATKPAQLILLFLKQFSLLKRLCPFLAALLQTPA